MALRREHSQVSSEAIHLCSQPFMALKYFTAVPALYQAVAQALYKASQVHWCAPIRELCDLQFERMLDWND